MSIPNGSNSANTSYNGIPIIPLDEDASDDSANQFAGDLTDDANSAEDERGVARYQALQVNNNDDDVNVTVVTLSNNVGPSIPTEQPKDGDDSNTTATETTTDKEKEKEKNKRKELTAEQRNYIYGIHDGAQKLYEKYEEVHKKYEELLRNHKKLQGLKKTDITDLVKRQKLPRLNATDLEAVSGVKYETFKTTLRRRRDRQNGHTQKRSGRKRKVDVEAAAAESNPAAESQKSNNQSTEPSAL
ncbi:hypothetical protein G210_3856 [Candida maltosa Xu316]|uniref:Uncharacterized protein n=1 Tax=Candida maltosa (strain Xu316) TaxID=1245528 RepID=M3JU90_CANMX|nr:hypothetical protein G210_3856 [Candida maltosa Xu316]